VVAGKGGFYPSFRRDVGEIGWEGGGCGR